MNVYAVIYTNMLHGIEPIIRTANADVIEPAAVPLDRLDAVGSDIIDRRTPNR